MEILVKQVYSMLITSITSNSVFYLNNIQITVFNITAAKLLVKNVKYNTLLYFSNTSNMFLSPFDVIRICLMAKYHFEIIFSFIDVR